jgi:hypothetical protein
VQELLARERALVASLREEAARQRSMRMGGMDKEAHALQQEVAGLTQQLQRQQMEAGEARGALLRAWQEERGELLRQFEEEAAASRQEAEGLAQRLRRQHEEAEADYASRVERLKQACSPRRPGSHLLPPPPPLFPRRYTP